MIPTMVVHSDGRAFPDQGTLDKLSGRLRPKILKVLALYVGANCFAIMSCLIIYCSIPIGTLLRLLNSLSVFKS